MSRLPATRRAFLRGLAALTVAGVAAGLSRWPATPTAADPAAPAEPGPADPEPFEAVAPDHLEELPPAGSAPIDRIPDATPTPSPRVPTLPVIGWEGWGARPARADYRLHVPRRVTVHHTAVSWTGGDTAAHLRGIQAFHQGPERRWGDVAYHYLIDRNGDVYLGRPEEAEPDTATDYDTEGHLALCLLGDLDVQRPSLEQMAALAGLIAWLLAVHSLPLSCLGGHRDYAATTCPGKHLHEFLRDGTLAARVAQLLG